MIILMPCPFCGAHLEQDDKEHPGIAFHPGTLYDGECIMSGRSVFITRDGKLWNRRKGHGI